MMGTAFWTAFWSSVCAGSAVAVVAGAAPGFLAGMAWLLAITSLVNVMLIVCRR